VRLKLSSSTSYVAPDSSFRRTLVRLKRVLNDGRGSDHEWFQTNSREVEALCTLLHSLVVVKFQTNSREVEASIPSTT